MRSLVKSAKSTRTGAIVLALMAVVSSSAGAQERDSAPARDSVRPGVLRQVTVTATRGSAATQPTATVHALSRRSITTSPARESQDLLREIPGVELPRTSSVVGGPEQIVSIRGVDEGRTLVLVDGIPINDAWGEWVNWSMVPKAWLDRVEVVEGGASSLYGSPAMGGVIQYFTRPMDRTGYSLVLDGGDRNARHVGATTSAVSGPVAAAFNLDLASGGGYRFVAPAQRGTIDRVSDSQRRNGGVRLQYRATDALSLSANAQLFDEDRDLGTPFQRASRRNGTASIGATYASAAFGRVTANVFGSQQRYGSYQSSVAADRATETPISFQNIPDHDVGANVQWTREGTGIVSSLSAGADARAVQGRIDERLYGQGGAVTGTRTAGGRQEFGGAFAQAILNPVEPLRVEGSVRVDGWRNYAGSRTGADGSVTTFTPRTDVAFSPRLGLRYQLLESLALRTSAYKAFRAPALSQEYRTFYGGPNTFNPNPRLGPEHTTGVDFGTDWTPIPEVQLSATVYTANMRDLATFVMVSPGQLLRENVENTRSTGGEAYLTVRPVSPLTIVAGANYDDDKIRSAPNPAQIGTRVGRVPVQKESLRATWDQAATGTLSLALRHEGVSSTLSGAPLAPFTVMDASARREVVPGAELFADLENITNRAYQVNLTGAIVSLGLPRTLRFGVQLTR